jgi:AMP-binding enzyme/Phosphopantetheine attachment site/AMP-binding enzyme C-terminal domain
VDPGETGEIAIRSRYLALGYWRRTELTRAKFLADCRDPSLRTYLTGDLGYRLPDGCLVLVGRKDFQAKIRGHRIELTAVETALHEIARIKQAVVLLRRDEPGGDRLIAYVVREEAAMLTVKQLRAELSLRLPSYMMPAAFVFLQSLPVNSAGKIDRHALPAPQIDGHSIDESSAARNAVEKVLLDIWRDALKLDGLGIHDDFTEIGGDSLLGAQIAARINDSFALAAPLGGLFHTPTVARLAEWLTEQTEPGQAEKVATILLHIDSMSDAAILAAIGERKPVS